MERRDGWNLSINLFGSFAAETDKGPLPPLKTRKEVQLLAILCLNHERPLSREQIAQTLWPNDLYTETNARAYLRRSLVNVRTALGEHRSRIIAADKGALTIDLTGVRIDVIDFDRLSKSGSPDDWLRAVELYCGSLLVDHADDWLNQERMQRLDKLREMCKRSAAIFVEHQDFHAAAGILRRALVQDSLCEDIVRHLMSTLVAGGDRSGALQVYTDLVRALQTRLEMDPDPHTTALYESIARTPRSAPVQLAARPQQHAASAESAFPLPTRLTRLIGRKWELEELVNRLVDSPLLSLVGTGGVGKTRLALAIGAASLLQFSDGVCFVDLSEETQPDKLMAAVADALSIRSTSDKQLQQQVVSFLKQKSILLILDNCEHLIEPCAQLAENLLAGCPFLHILTTGRRRLGIAGEIVWEVQPLATPDPELLPLGSSSSLGLLTSFSSVELLVERIQSLDPSFRVTPANCISIARICRYVDGIPLALELVAPRLQTMAAEDVANRLDSKMLLLALGSNTATARQRTVRALVEWSFDLLTDEEQNVACTLSTFRGGCLIEAAEAVCAHAAGCGGDIAESVHELVMKSLLTAERTADLPVRYRMLETVREYCLEALQERGDEVRIRQEHAFWYMQFAQISQGKLTGPEQLPWLRALDRERDNLRAAFDWVVQNKRDGSMPLEFAAALVHYWEIRGQNSDGRRRIDAAITASARQPDHLLGTLYAMSASFADAQADVRAKLAYGDLALTHAVASGDPAILSLAQHIAGFVYRTADVERCHALMRESVSVARQLGDAWIKADSMNSLGFIELLDGDTEGAQRLFEEALECANQVMDSWLSGQIVYHLGMTAMRRGDLDTAYELMQEALAVQKQLDDQQFIGTILLFVGSIDILRGNWLQGVSACQRSLANKWIFGNMRGVAATLDAVARVSLQKDDLYRCVRLCSAVERYLGSVDSPFFKFWEETPADMLAACRARMNHMNYTAAVVEGRTAELKDTVQYAMHEFFE